MKKERSQGEKMKTELAKIDTLRPDPRNARLHNRRNIDAIKASLQRFGQQKPLVVDMDGTVRAGNGTLEAARELGWENVAIVRTSLTEDEAVAFGIADNRLNELSDWDPEQLASLLSGIEDPELVEIAGYDAAELDELLGSVAELDEAAAASSGDRPLTMSKGGTLPAVRILMLVQDIATVERALLATGCVNRAEALLEVCKAYEKRQQHVDA